jgi:hypothetical protein
VVFSSSEVCVYWIVYLSCCYSSGALLRQGDTTIDDFFVQLSVVWRRLDTLGP